MEFDEDMQSSLNDAMKWTEKSPLSTKIKRDPYKLYTRKMVLQNIITRVKTDSSNYVDHEWN